MPIPQSSCPACLSKRRRRIPVVNLWEGVEWQHVRCSRCDHRYLELYPSDGELERMYDRSYFEDGGSWVCGFWGGSYESNETHLRGEARRAIADLPCKSGTLLEIGCAGGFFLDEARLAGFDVLGVELNPEMVEHARETLGLTVHCGMFERVGLNNGSFDVIVVQDVMEHVREPRKFTEHAAALLKAGGHLFVRGPLEDLTKERVYLAARKLTGRGAAIVNEAPFHLQGFNAESFRKVIASAGLMPVSFRPEAALPHLDFRSRKGAAASLIERVSWAVDRVRGGGDFMTATARAHPIFGSGAQSGNSRSDPQPESVGATRTQGP